MVSLAPASRNSAATPRDVTDSVDSAVQRLLIDESDPLALAVYLWTLQDHDIQLVNGDGLANWGLLQVRRVLIDGQIGRRKDEDVAVAALAAVALKRTGILADVVGDVAEGLRRLLAAEMDHHLIPFRRPSYAIILLLAARAFDVDEPYPSTAQVAVADAFIGAIPGGRLFGLGFVVALLRGGDYGEVLASLDARAQDGLMSPATEYEDQLYLAQALLLLRHGSAGEDDAVRLAERVLIQSPIWSYIMTGVEEVYPAGDGTIAVPVSHLYRAALLDVALRVEEHAAARTQAQQDARYRGRGLVGMAAFGFVAVVLAAVWAVLGHSMIPIAGATRRYWLLNDYHALSVPAALLSLSGAVFITFLAPFTLVTLWTAWTLLARARIESDRRILEVMSRRTWTLLKWWAIAVALAILLNLATGQLGPGLQHTFNPTGR